MTAVGDLVANPRTGAMVEVTAWPEIAGPGRVEIRRLLRPRMGFPLPHVHIDTDEIFHVEVGVADARVGHRSLRLGPGEEFRVSRYDVHVNPMNRSTTDLVLLQAFESARTDVAQRYVRTLMRFIKEGRDVRGDLPPLVALAVFAGRHQQTYAPWISRKLQRRVIFPLAKSYEEWREERRRRNDREMSPVGSSVSD